MQKQLKQGCLACALIVFGIQVAAKNHANPPDPWFTGPLLAQEGSVVPAGHVNIEPYFFDTMNLGAYNDRWHFQRTPQLTSLSPSLDLTVGLFKRWDIEAVPAYLFNTRSGQRAIGWGDLPVTVGFQPLYGKLNTWRPDLRIGFTEIFPTGSYTHLNPSKAGTDSMGQGSYQTGISGTFQWRAYFGGVRFLQTRFFISYTVPASVHVSGLNAYGGAANTVGTVDPGSQLLFDLSFEYAVTRHWVPVMEVTWTHTTAAVFHGTPGTVGGQPASVGNPSQDVMAIAPAIEYNWNATVGVIAGAWLTVLGRNATGFVSGVIAVNFYI